jgi:pSer/pThr/pTyr-binding forkhead associated (FHA) protein
MPAENIPAKENKRRRPMAVLVLLHEGLTIKKIPIEKNKLSIGRQTECDIFLDDNMVSANHAAIEMQENPDKKGTFDFFVEDLQSTNHTMVNGEAVTRRKLEHNDKIRIGRHVFKFIDETAASADKTTKLVKSWIPGVYYTKE